jgi:hypothetical protein
MHKDLPTPQEKRGSGSNVKKIQETPQCSELRAQIENEKKSARERVAHAVVENHPTKLESTYRQQCQ